MQPRRSKQVLVFAGGGLTHVSGGVGTLMRYLMAEWARDPASMPVRVIDTRGAGGPVSAVAQFAAALLQLAGGRVVGIVAAAHIHMTTRGSALRKSMLCATARLLGVPVILHLHGADFFDFYDGLPRLPQALLRRVIAGAGCIVVIGTAWRDRLVRDIGIPAGSVRVVLNGVPAAPRNPERTGPARILFLGRIGARKGVPELVAALGAPAMRSRAWSANIAGDGDTAPCAAQIAHAGLQARIALPGWLDEAAAASALCDADILVLPSHHEVMPIAILEAMARGLAIVTTPVGAIPEILTDGVNCRLVPPGEPARLAAALAALIDDPGERRRLGLAAHGTFTTRLDIAIPAAELQAIYRQVPAPMTRPSRARIASA